MNVYITHTYVPENIPVYQGYSLVLTMTVKQQQACTGSGRVLFVAFLVTSCLLIICYAWHVCTCLDLLNV